jgi:hypothetical protein
VTWRPSQCRRTHAETTMQRIWRLYRKIGLSVVEEKGPFLGEKKKILDTDFEEAEAGDDCVGESQQQFNRPISRTWPTSSHYSVI